MQSNSLIYNGAYFFIRDFVPEYDNRAFRYGDSVFETIFCSNGKLTFFKEHIQRITNAAEQLKMKMPEKFNKYPELIETEIQTLLRKNKIFKSAIVRLTVFRKTGGLYTPQNNEINYLIEVKKHEQDIFEHEKNIVKIGVYTEVRKQINILSSYKTGNSLLNVLAGIYKTENNFDDVIILNENKFVCETISSNLFFAKAKTIITPSLSSGCVAGIIREQVILASKKLGFEIIEKEETELSDLLSADEIFLTNSIAGVRKVTAFENKRYFGKISQNLVNYLNELIKK